MGRRANMIFWLIQQAALSAITSAAKAGHTAAPEAMADFTARANSSDNPALSVAGDRAEIAIKGVLTPQPDWMAAFFGGGNTAYRDIVAAIAIAEADDSVKEITYYVDSPGGSVMGMFEAMSAIKNTTKPSVAYVANANSAAYGLASQARKVVALGKASSFGSVGVVVGGYIDEDYVEVTSTNAPDKRPDLSTEEGKAVVRAQLDEYEGIFSGQIAEGRGTTVEKVNADFGRGAVVLARNALDRGMIDEIEADGLLSGHDANRSTATSGGETTEANIMDLQELKAKHPGLYAQAVEEGVKKERDRVSAHLIKGNAAGAIDIAIEAIEAGEGMTAKIDAKYFAAALDKRDLENTEADAETTTEVTDGADTSTDAEAQAKKDAEAGDKLLSNVAADLGIDIGAGQ